MPQRHRSGSGTLRGCRESSIPHDAHLVDAGRNLVGMHQPFMPAQPRQGTISLCGAVFITYLVCASCLGVVGLVTIITTHRSIGDHLMQRRLIEPEDLPSSTTHIKVGVLRPSTRSVVNSVQNEIETSGKVGSLHTVLAHIVGMPQPQQLCSASGVCWVILSQTHR